MTQDEIIEMAREAASHGVEKHPSGEVNYVFYNEHLMNFAKLVAEKAREEFGLLAVGMLERTVARAVAKEREACAKSLEDSAETATNFQAKVLIEWCATHIRARGNT